MSARNRFATCLFTALLLLAAAAPATAVQSSASDHALPRISITAFWDWFAGLLVVRTDETKGQIVPEGGTADPTPLEDPLAPQTTDAPASETPQA
ncbi:MAG: hypothetical protein H6511_02735 [Holophagales bacterium]|nr:hypothetical protein [Holophagales bacterium]